LGEGDCDLPNEPDSFDATSISDSEIELTWEHPGGEIEGYVILACGSDLGIIFTTNTSYTFSGLIPGTLYSFIINSYNIYGVSNVTSCQSATTTGGGPGVPEDFYIEDVTTTTMDLDWVAPVEIGAGIDYYEVKNCATGIIEGSPGGSSFTVTDLLPGSYYEFQVRAVDDDGNYSSYTSCEGETTDVLPGVAPTTPTALAAYGFSTTAITISWAFAADANYYQLYRCYPDEYITDVYGTIYVDNDLLPGTEYFYKIKAINDFGESSFTSCESGITLEIPITPDIPTGFEATAISESVIHLNWNEAEYASGYEIRYCDEVYIGFTYADLFIDVTGLVEATEYDFKIRAFNYYDYSDYTSCVSETTLGVEGPPEIPFALLATPASPTEIQLTWDDADGATHYKVYTCGGTYLGIVYDNNFLDGGLLPGSFHNYKVNAWNDIGEFSDYSICANATTPLDEIPPPSPSELYALAVSENEIYLSWDLVATATHYEIYFCDEDDVLGSSTTNDFFVTGLSPSTYYDFYVKSFNGAIPSLDYSPCAGTTTFDYELPFEYLKAINNVPYVTYLSDEQTITYFEPGDIDNPPIKICADGSEATIIEIKVTDLTIIDDLRFRIASDPYGYESEISGWFIEADYDIDGDILRARYTHPKYLDIPGIYKSDELEIVNITTEEVLFEYPIEFYRAPLIMVHGLFGSPGAYNEMNPALDFLYPSILKWVVNYEGSNDVSFDENAEIVPNEVECLLVTCRENNYSTGKVDIIAHSMGGNLTRIYLQSEYYQDDVHKFISINTPHSGSQMADYLYPFIIDVDYYDNPLLFDYVDVNLELAWIAGYNVYNGAVENLRVMSYQIDELLNSDLSLENNTVPTHVITTYVEDESDLEEEELNTVFSGISTIFYDMNVMDFYQSLLFGFVNHDGIVSEPSQLCGLDGLSTTQDIIQKHRGAANNEFVIDKVVELIDEAPEADFFTSELDPVNLSYIYFRSDQISEDSNSVINNGAISITQPINNETFEAGSLLNISLSVADSINSIVLFVGNNFTKREIVAIDPIYPVYEYQIRNDYIGKINICVSGLAENTLGWDTLSINVISSYTLDSITINPEQVYVVDGFVRPIQIFGHYSDGTAREISYIEALTINTLHDSIARRDSINLILGVDTGSTIMVVDYLGISKIFDVNVIPANAGLVEYIENINSENTIVNYNINEATLTSSVIPNPFSSKTNIKFDLPILSKVIINIYNIDGVLIEQVFNGIKSEGGHFIEFNSENLPSGIYFYKISAGKEIGIGKMIKID